MIMTKKIFIIISSCLTVLMVSLIIMNEYNMYQVTELCKEIGGTPDVDKDFFKENWSVNCDRTDVGINQ